MKIVIKILALVVIFSIVVFAQTDDQIKAFMYEQIKFDKYVFPPGEFPEFKWENEDEVEQQIGTKKLSAVFYNRNFQAVSKADSPGRYGAILESVTPSGFVVKRYVTLYCAPVEFDDYSKNVPIIMNMLNGYKIPEENWLRYYTEGERFSFGSLKFFPQQNPDAAVFLAGLSELNPQKKYETPRIKDKEWWITLRLLLEHNSPGIPLLLRKSTNISRLDSLINASEYDKQIIDSIRFLCNEKFKKDEFPQVTLIVHNGEIIFNEAFGDYYDQNSPGISDNFWMASITKLLTGVLMMMFVDQNIINLDSPVANYLPELKGPNQIIIRELFTHTTGLDFAGEWASDWNNSLENQIAHLLGTVELSKEYSYNRVGYAVAGKILERITGKTIPELFNTYIFSPLEMTSAYSDNSYGGLYCSAYDLAKLGQMLLNKGSYNGFEIFSESSFFKMMPQQLPNSNRKWGIGTTGMNTCGLSTSAFGHSAASGSIFKVDPENNLVIISARNNSGRDDKEFECKLVEKCISLIKGN